MSELIAHLIGDYCLQSHVMATHKTSDIKWAAIHAFLYSLPFLPLLAMLQGTTPRVAAWLIITVTHALIDRYAIARRWCQWYGVGYPGMWSSFGEFVAPPPFLGVWLTIIVDNTMHITINHFALGLL